MSQSRCILELEAQEVRSYFLKSSSYCSVDLPSYFTFDDVLNKVSKKIGSSDISSYFKEKVVNKKRTAHAPREYEDVNHLLLANKDGEFSWRPYEVIHPVLYVGLVHYITEDKNWSFLKERFVRFKKTKVVCESIPLESKTEESDRAEQVKMWWRKIEQESIKLGLVYQYVFDADISDCYGSIYTHSISWALHSKKESKQKRKPNQLHGNKIDWFIQAMRYGQTNGIPQGSVLMDFIAEMILGHVDELLVEKNKIRGIRQNQYKIIRYRDDYKIFTNEPHIGRHILKNLSEVLSQLGIKLNTSKTRQSSDPILASVKEDKLDELFVPTKRTNLSKWLLQIYVTTSKHPNSGKVPRQLNKFYTAINYRWERGLKLENYEDLEVMISIVVNIAIKSPAYYSWCMAIVSVLLGFCSRKDKKLRIIKDIHKRFNLIPNTGLLDIWLHRISSEISSDIDYSELLTLLPKKPYPGNNMWCSDWIKDSLKNIVNTTPVIDFAVYNSKSLVISKREVELFRLGYSN